MAASCRPSCPTCPGRAPLWNSEVRGLLLGLAAEHGPAEIARAVLAGTLLSARHVLDVVEAATGGPVTEIEFAGRAAGDESWQAVALETLGARVRFHSDPDLSARGAAMLAAMTTEVSLAWLEVSGG
jgi:sugar (pentulose or hexulose) kinase